MAVGAKARRKLAIVVALVVVDLGTPQRGDWWVLAFEIGVAIPAADGFRSWYLLQVVVVVVGGNCLAVP